MKKLIVSLSIAAIATIGIIVFFTSLNYASSQPSTVKPETIATEGSVSGLINKERAKVGVNPLTVNSDIRKSAQLKADDMFNRDYRSHYLPEDSAATLTPEMASLINPVCSESSENFVYNREADLSAEGALEWWLNSPAHKEALLNPKYNLTGIGVSSDKRIVVQHFCVSH